MIPDSSRVSHHQVSFSTSALHGAHPAWILPSASSALATFLVALEERPGWCLLAGLEIAQRFCVARRACASLWEPCGYKEHHTAVSWNTTPSSPAGSSQSRNLIDTLLECAAGS